MGTIITITSKKGGSAKTTTTVNLASAIAEKNKKVLVIDMDSQGHATIALGKSPYNESKSVFDVFSNSTFKAKDAVIQLDFNNMYLIPSSFRLEELSIGLGNTKGSGFILKEKLKEIKNEYDFIFIDTPPLVGIMTINALVAADSIIIPMQQHFLSMESLAQIIKFVHKIKEKANPGLEIKGIIPTMAELYTTHSKQVLNEILGHFGQKLFNTRIHKDIKLAEAPSYGIPITIYAKNSKGAEDYRKLAEEVLAYEKV